MTWTGPWDELFASHAWEAPLDRTLPHSSELLIVSSSGVDCVDVLAEYLDQPLHATPEGMSPGSFSGCSQAQTFGAGDVLAGPVARHVGTLRTVLGGLIVSLLAIIVVFLLSGNRRLPSDATTIFLVGWLGIVRAGGYIALVEAFSIGPLAVVSPITGAGGPNPPPWRSYCWATDRARFSGLRRLSRRSERSWWRRFPPPIASNSMSSGEGRCSRSVRWSSSATRS